VLGAQALVGLLAEGGRLVPGSGSCGELSDSTGVLILVNAESRQSDLGFLESVPAFERRIGVSDEIDTRRD
jgi:hypothetical protein